MNYLSHIEHIELKHNIGDWGVAQWYSICLLCVRALGLVPSTAKIRQNRTKQMNKEKPNINKKL
jgi:hypothetical protein